MLQLTGAASAVGLAGCTGSQDPSDGEDSGGQPTDGGGQEGGDDHDDSHDQVSEPQAAAEVAVNTARNEGSAEYHFDPHSAWVEVGGTVTWVLESGTHTATAYHPGNDQPRLVPEGTESWDSGTMSEEGETFEHTFDTEGVYHYLCVPHEQFGMLATVIVGNPDLSNQTALQTMPENKSEEVRGKIEELNSLVREIVGDDHDDEEDDHEDEEDSHDESIVTGVNHNE
jgi:plastocyanin